MSTTYRTAASGFAKALPSRAVTNDDLSQMMDTSDEWITKRTGIQTRYWVEEPTTTSDLGVEAAKSTLEKLGNPRVAWRMFQHMISVTNVVGFCTVWRWQLP
jgi:hypothetical protein